MSYQWPQAQSSAAQPCGTCPQCGGQMYALLTHHCTTAVRWSLPYRDLSPIGGGPNPCGASTFSLVPVAKSAHG